MISRLEVNMEYFNRRLLPLARLSSSTRFVSIYHLYEQYIIWKSPKLEKICNSIQMYPFHPGLQPLWVAWLNLSNLAFVLLWAIQPSSLPLCPCRMNQWLLCSTIVIFITITIISNITTIISITIITMITIKIAVNFYAFLCPLFM